jgi:hypothetical protein
MNGRRGLTLVLALVVLIDPYPWSAPLEEVRLRKR